MNPIELAERGLVPDWLTRMGIRRILAHRLESESIHQIDDQSERMRERLAELRESEIALSTDIANEQHYEVPAEFFDIALGPHRKYSACYWPEGTDTLGQAEARMLELTCERADLADGQDILELGCGWGAVTLWMAKHYPNSRITAVSNSSGQRRKIEAECERLGLPNVQVITADVREFSIDRQFDRIVSVEMFEHMRNYETLLERISGWLKPDGRLFVHVFCHKNLVYPFEDRGRADWMARYFFTDGLMPSADTLLQFQEHLVIEDYWRMSGTHYERTAEAWLDNLDASSEEALEIFRSTYGAVEAKRWVRRWRMFFLACAELFGYRDGTEWVVAHYRFARR